MTTVLIIGFTTAFVLSAIDYWKYLGFWRAVIALAVSALTGLLLGLDYLTVGVYSIASSFVAMTTIQLIEYVNLRALSRR
jgi:hypothetical protein